jgi:hypothetical protein
VVNTPSSGAYCGPQITSGSVRNCGSSGIHIGASSDWHFNHFGSGGNGGHGIYNVGGQMIRVIDPDIYSNTLSGIRMDDTADDIWISGGSIDRNLQHGFLINGDVGVDEEKWLSEEKPREMQMPNCILGSALCAHFAFYKQRDWMDQTDVLRLYHELRVSTIKKG